MGGVGVGAVHKVTLRTAGGWGEGYKYYFALAGPPPPQHAEQDQPDGVM
jgi:hypothetical protein